MWECERPRSVVCALGVRLYTTHLLPVDCWHENKKERPSVRMIKLFSFSCKQHFLRHIDFVATRRSAGIHLYKIFSFCRMRRVAAFNLLLSGLAGIHADVSLLYRNSICLSASQLLHAYMAGMAKCTESKDLYNIYFPFTAEFLFVRMEISGCAKKITLSNVHNEQFLALIVAVVE